MAKQAKPSKVEKSENVANPTPFVTPRQAAAQLHCSEDSIRHMVRTGELQGAKIGGRYKITRASVDALLYRLLGGTSRTDGVGPVVALRG